MNRYSWTSAYLAAIEEYDQIELQKRIGTANTLMGERLSTLLGGYMTSREREEFRRLCDARRALDLLQRVSNDLDLFAPEARRKSA